MADTAKESEVYTESTKELFVDASTGRPVAVIGVEGVAIVDSPNGLLSSISTMRGAFPLR